MSPMGRPSDDPKTKRLGLRLSDNDIEKLEYCCKRTGLSRAEIVRRGIQKVYDELNNKK